MDGNATPDRLEVSRRIAADRSAIFDLLRNPRGHVAIDASGVLMGATGDAVGSNPVVSQALPSPGTRSSSASARPVDDAAAGWE